MLAYFRVPIGWGELARRTVADTIEDDCPGLAAQLAFYFLLALFPALLFLVALLSFLPLEARLDRAIAQLHTLMPNESLEIIRQQINAALAGSSGGLLTFGIAGAVWSSSTAMTAIITALNRAYDLTEIRPWWRVRANAVVLTLALAALTAAALVLVASGTDIVRWAAERSGLGEPFVRVWRVVQWPLAIVAVVSAVNFIYYFAPSARTRWVWFTPGSLLATVLWLLVSIGFRLYVQNFPSYSAVYGAIVGVILLLMWFYLSGFALLLGAELDGEIGNAQRAARR